MILPPLVSNPAEHTRLLSDNPVILRGHGTPYPYKMCLLLVLLVLLTACGAPPATPIPNLTGTPRPAVPVPEYSEPAAPINRLNAPEIGYLGRLDPDSGTASSIISAAFAPNSTRLAVLDAQQIMLWDVIQGRRLFATDHQGAQAVFYSPEKTEVYTIRADGSIVVYDDVGSEKTVLIGHEAYNGRFAYDSLNGWLALGGRDGTIRIWDVAAREAKATLTGHSDEINLLAFSADGTALASVGFDQQVIWWAWATRTERWRVTLEGDSFPLRLTIAPNMLQMALASETQLLLYDPTDGRRIAALPLPAYGAEDVLRYTPDSQKLVAASRRAPMTLWNVQTGQLIGQFPEETGSRISAAFSPDGELMLMAILDKDKGVALWDLTQASSSGIPRLDVAAPSTRIVDVLWSDDGYLIALLGALGEVYIMGIPQGEAQ